MTFSGTRVLAVLALAMVASSVLLVMSLKKSDADIIDVLSGPTRTDAEFLRVLESMGHDRFETYEINGQTIHTSVRHVVGSSPTRLMREYQHQMVVHGINDRAYHDLTSGKAEDRLFSGLKGGLVPFRYEKDHIAMGGVITENHAVTDDEARAAAEKMAIRPGSFKGYRNIEIMRPAGTGRTTVFASWSDALDYEDFQPGSEALDGPRFDDVARCPSCVRIHHFQHPRRSLTDRGAHVFSGERSPSYYRDWYSEEFRNQGFEVEPFSQADQLLYRSSGFRSESQMVVFRKEALVRTLTLYRAGGATFAHVHTQLSVDTHDWSDK